MCQPRMRTPRADALRRRITWGRCGCEAFIQSTRHQFFSGRGRGAQSTGTMPLLFPTARMLDGACLDPGLLGARSIRQFRRDRAFRPPPSRRPGRRDLHRHAGQDQGKAGADLSSTWLRRQAAAPICLPPRPLTWLRSLREIRRPAFANVRPPPSPNLRAHPAAAPLAATVGMASANMTSPCLGLAAVCMAVGLPPGHFVPPIASRRRSMTTGRRLPVAPASCSHVAARALVAGAGAVRPMHMKKKGGSGTSRHFDGFLAPPPDGLVLVGLYAGFCGLCESALLGWLFVMPPWLPVRPINPAFRRRTLAAGSGWGETDAGRPPSVTLCPCRPCPARRSARAGLGHGPPRCTRCGIPAAASPLQCGAASCPT